MTNILPLDAQKKIWSMYRARFLIAASLVSLALSALAALALVPSYLALQLAAPPLVDAVTYPGADTPSDIATVSRTQALIVALTPVLSATTSPSQLILLALNSRPAGVIVTHITYTAQPALIEFSGAAPRDAISSYRDDLAKSSVFTSVSVPVNSLIGNDTSFTMSLGGNF